MRIPLTVLLLAAGARADTWSLERLFTRPFIWGTRPDNIRWSKQGRVLGFLWNSGGGRFLDLYTWHADRRQLVRVTRLETLEDPLNRTQAEKDDRQKHYLPPPEGLADYDLSADGTRAVFSYRGDLWVA